ncbi:MULTISPECIES: hypothetical protein [Deinococcus]|uniref:Restriction endonuclease type IV Mrr domain-containing protein n=1 Tax=Deinococcus rufus TaxID=2136097 RepID=A0ABV7Z9W5_9DEIO|nr:hypothetical protein [Deinococcus sp. AB2017081]WQE95608.1 hypothetical protein U2P90_01645 [Deinococcus sp. AB2017081]
MAEHSDLFAEIVSEIIFNKRAAVRETHQFTYLKHNSDLCPLVERKLSHIRDAFLKHSAISYDVQGFGDQGTDVLLKYKYGNSANWKYISIQIKSHDDLGKKGVEENLQAQLFKIQTEYGAELEHIYLITCYSLKDRLRVDTARRIAKSIANSPKISLVSPDYAAPFIIISSNRVSAIIDSYLNKDDAVLKRARDELWAKTPLQRYILIRILVLFYVDNNYLLIDASGISEISDIKEFASLIPDYIDDYMLALVYGDKINPKDYDINIKLDRARSCFIRTLDSLEGLSESIQTDDATFGLRSIAMEQCLGLITIIISGNIKYGYSKSALTKYVFTYLNCLGEYTNPGLDGFINQDLDNESF